MKKNQNLTAEQLWDQPGFIFSIGQCLRYVFLILLVSLSSASWAQFGVYEFVGPSSCPNQNPNVTVQPANAVFSSFSTVNADCKSTANEYVFDKWNKDIPIDLTEYNQFTITPNAGYGLNLSSLSFTQYTNEDQNPGTTTWALRSSVDNYSTNIASGTATTTIQTPVVTFPSAVFSNLGTVTFRFYIINAKASGTLWSMDNVSVSGSSVIQPANPGNPISDSPQCSNPGVTLTAVGAPPAGETWYWQTSATGTSTVNSSSIYTVNTSGTYYLRSQDNTTLAWSSGAGSIAVTVTPDVSSPVFSLGTSSTRCQGANTVTYTASASNTTGITYSLDATSITGGNAINSATGAVTYVAGWSGTTTITSNAAGCNGPQTSIHTVTITPSVATPVFASGANSIRCLGAATINYTATAANATGITYSLDALSILGGNSINSSTGDVTFSGLWVGNSAITATATGCNGPRAATHLVTVNGAVGTPVFALGASSGRCQGAGTVTYSASAINSSGITYSLDAASISGGNSINSSTGAVTYTAGWSGVSTITATATGCNGPTTATHTVTTNPPVTTPVFSLGANSTRCQGAGAAAYTASATNTTGITYSLNAAAIAGGNSINSSTGTVTYTAGWTGATIITASASGCGGPLTATHTVSITPTVGLPVFISGANSTRCLGAGTVTYSANATNNTGITYSLDATSLAGGNTINSLTGEVSYDASWTGASIITASAEGCNGPRTTSHTATTNAYVGVPVFTLGISSTRCQGSGSVTYAATATAATGITYSLDATSLAGGNTINTSTGAISYSAAWSGTSTVTASAAGCSGPQTSTHTITITPTVGTPAFASGPTTIRCQGAGTVSYGASSTNTTGITYSLNAASLSAGNTINSTTGDVTYTAGWTGVSTITASAAGCSGPRTATHSATTTASVGTPVFVSGASSTRCQGAGTVTYTATATTSTGISYDLDATSLAAGNNINTLTGAVTYTSGWTGTSVITATATGCNGPTTSSHTVTITPTVGTPVFVLGPTSTRCQGSGTVSYSASATNSTSITYSLNFFALSAGNTINSSTGVVTYAAGWTGGTTITASAAGCNGPVTSTHSVTITPTVSTPVFTLGSTSTRCQGAGNVTYTATASNTTGITYSLDAATLAGGNTINSSTGEVTYVAGWSGSSTITASAAGCNGPRTSTHTITTTATVGTPVFTGGATSTRCQGSGTVTNPATATTTTGITYSLNAASLAGGNTINSSTGSVTYSAGWSGTTIITASAAGCNGPSTATRTVTVTPTVGTPVFVLAASSTRCQGAGPVTYTATSTNNTGITYLLNAAAISGGNSINSSTGVVTYAAAWTGTTIITASATGCNGPASSSHTVTITPTVATPVFAAGPVSMRLQGAATITYSATALNTSGITYSLDATSISAGNTINSSTGAVTFTSAWSGTTTITASASGCSGPRTAFHTVTINATSVVKQLYLSDPAQALDRVDPVNTADNTTASTTILSTVGTTSATFTMAPVLCSPLTIKAGTITVRNYVTVSTGTMPANPNITAVLRYGATTIITLTNPNYNSVTNLITWTGTLATDITVPAGNAISLQVTTALAGVNFRIDYDSQTKPSRIDLPVSSFIDVTSLDIYSAAYPGGIPVITAVGGTTKYIRATVTDPFGFNDITGMNIQITPGSTVAATSVATAGCSRTYQYVWNTPAASGTYGISATAREGFENTVTHTKNINFDLCITCAPIALNDSASGAGGNPIVVDVLANDNDPNNNINPSSLAIAIDPSNGSAYISNNTIVYLPNGTFQGRDTLTYQICDLTSPTPLCATAQVFFNIDPLIVDICADAAKTHTYYIPYPENQSYTALLASSNSGMPSNNIRTIISIKVPYPGMTIVWDEWEDGYEANPLNPTQPTTKVWGDGNPFNGIVPGFGNDIIPAGASIVMDNTMNANPRNPATIYYDGKDKIVSSGQIAMTQVSGEPSRMPVQAIKTNITSVYDFGQSFTIPLGENFNSRDFMYTALFIRASENNTTVSIDKDNNGSFETTVVLNEGGSYFVNGGVFAGATVASDKPVGVELNSGGVDNFSIRNAPIFPATWYSNVYYTPVPTSDVAGNNPKDTSVVMLYNSLSRPISINWYSGAPASGVINIPAKTTVRFPLAYSATATYKFVNLTGESFTAIEIVDSYTPGGGGNGGMEYDWAFNLIAEARLTDFATIAWAPGSFDGSRNDNPIWVTPSQNTTVYVKYNGDVSNGPNTSPCGLKYNVAIPLNALNYTKIKDLSDNDQSGTAIYTCDGAKIAAVYGEDPATAVPGSPSWDVGATIQPFCKQRIVIAADDYATTLVSQPVTITVLDNDFGFLCTIDPTTVATLGLLQPRHGTTSINDNGTILYRPDIGYSGLDTFEYRVCSNPSPIVCDIGLVVIRISTCPTNGNQNIISGQVYIDRNNDAVNNDGGAGLAGVKVYLYNDGNCSGTISANELTDSVTVDSSGFYQFTKYPEKTVSDNFDNGSGGRSCANGTDGDTPWSSNWTDTGDGSVGFCQAVSNADVEITQDGTFGFALRIKDNDVSARRSVNLNGATKAFLTFSYRRKSATLTSGEDIFVQASSNGTSFTTIYTIAGNGTTDANYVTIYNQDITAYANTNSAIRFLTNSSVDDADTVYIDNVSIIFLKYPQCYVTSFDLVSKPADYNLTTAGQRATTITSGGTCTSQFDFGFSKPNVTVSGRLRNDANGLTDGIVNGTATGAPDGIVVYAYLVDVSGKVALKATVNSATAVYSFPLAEINTSYTLILSTVNVALGSNPPSSLNGPSTWVPVGERYGTGNAAGTGVETGVPNAAIEVRTALTNVTNVDIGIERLPNSDNHIRSINQPKVGQYITLNGQGLNPPVLSGTDPEDCTVGCDLTGRQVIIDTVPNNAELYYNNALVSNGQSITNFNSNLFQAKMTAATLGDISIAFRYSFVDAALLKDPTPATYTLMWLVPLPAVGLNVSAMLNEKDNVSNVKWSTQSEQNTSYFIVERSVDNVNFQAVSSKIQAAGNSESRRDYETKDNVRSLLQNDVIYYRIKLFDIDGKITYSNVVAVRISRKPGVTIWPNPFQSAITISITNEKESTIDINIIDVNGRVLRSSSQKVPKGISLVNMNNLDRLPGGVYLVEITDKLAGTTFQKLIKNK